MKELGRILCNTPARLQPDTIVIFPVVISKNLKCQVPAADWFVGWGTNSEECSAGIYKYTTKSDVNEIAGKKVLIN